MSNERETTSDACQTRAGSTYPTRRQTTPQPTPVFAAWLLNYRSRLEELVASVHKRKEEAHEEERRD